jgi:hypothetical protein
MVGWLMSRLYEEQPGWVLIRPDENIVGAAGEPPLP